MAEAVRNIVFPEYISFQSQAGDSWATQVVRTSSGYELRNSLFAHPLRQFDVNIDNTRAAEMAEIRDFFNSVRGRAYSFRFRDWADYLWRHDGGDDPIAFANYTGTGAYQLTKTYATGGYSYVRPVKFPRVQGTSTPPGVSWDTTQPFQDFELFIDSTPLTMGVHYSVSATTGMVTILTGLSGAVLKARFEYDIPVRFDTDMMDAVKESYATETWASIKLREVRV